MKRCWGSNRCQYKWVVTVFGVPIVKLDFISTFLCIKWMIDLILNDKNIVFETLFFIISLFCACFVNVSNIFKPWGWNVLLFSCTQTPRLWVSVYFAEVVPWSRYSLDCATKNVGGRQILIEQFIDQQCSGFKSNLNFLSRFIMHRSICWWHAKLQ